MNSKIPYDNTYPQIKNSNSNLGSFSTKELSIDSRESINLESVEEQGKINGPKQRTSLKLLKSTSNSSASEFENFIKEHPIPNGAKLNLLKYYFNCDHLNSDILRVNFQKHFNNRTLQNSKSIEDSNSINSSFLHDSNNSNRENNYNNSSYISNLNTQLSLNKSSFERQDKYYPSHQNPVGYFFNGDKRKGEFNQASSKYYQNYWNNKYN